MKARSFLFGAAAAVCSALFLAAASDAAEEVQVEGVRCVVAAREAKAANAADYKGAKVFFCCQNCPKAFAADTAKYASSANRQLVATAQAEQVKCPLTGKDLDPDVSLEVASVAVGFCCNGCKGKVARAEGAEQVDLVFSDAAFQKGFQIAEKDE